MVTPCVVAAALTLSAWAVRVSASIWLKLSVVPAAVALPASLPEKVTVTLLVRAEKSMRSWSVPVVTVSPPAMVSAPKPSAIRNVSASAPPKMLSRRCRP